MSIETSNYFCRKSTQEIRGVLNYTRKVSKMLETDLEFRKGILFIRLNGELTKKTVSQLEEEVTKKIKKSGIQNIVFNIEKLINIDLKGINALFYNYELCHQNNGKSLLCGISNPEIKVKLEKSRLLKYISETETELSAFDLIHI